MKEEKIISCEYGKFKISFHKEIVPINIIFPSTHPSLQILPLSGSRTEVIPPSSEQSLIQSVPFEFFKLQIL